MNRIRRRLTYANVMSSLAVFLVLGGATAFAATQLAKNSVGANQLKKNAVTAAKIKNNAVSGAKIADNSISGAKLQNGAVSGAKVDAATLGTVPNATHATSADTAASAATAGTARGIGTLPSGKSQSGFYAGGGGEAEEGFLAEGVTFQQPLPAAIPTGNVEWLEAGDLPTEKCPGVGQAAPGYLCLYDNEEYEVELCCIYDFALNEPAADKNGFIVYWEATGTGSYVSGEWTVTAP